MQRLPSKAPKAFLAASRDTAAAQGRALVVYVFSATNKAFAGNMRFFIRHAMQQDAGDDVDYVVLVQGAAALEVCCCGSQMILVLACS